MENTEKKTGTNSPVQKISNFVGVKKSNADGNSIPKSLLKSEIKEQDERGSTHERMFEQLVDITNQIDYLTEEASRIKTNFLKELKLLEVDGEETIIYRENGVEQIHMRTSKVYIYSSEMQKLEKANKDQREKLTNLKKNEVISGIATLKSQSKTAVFIPAPKPKKKKK